MMQDMGLYHIVRLNEAGCVRLCVVTACMSVSVKEVEM